MDQQQEPLLFGTKCTVDLERDTFDPSAEQFMAMPLHKSCYQTLCDLQGYSSAPPSEGYCEDSSSSSQSVYSCESFCSYKNIDQLLPVVEDFMESNGKTRVCRGSFRSTRRQILREIKRTTSGRR